MKMIYGGVPYNTLKLKHFEVPTNDATCEPTAVQAGLTYYANGRKQVGTGKSFEFATYGTMPTNNIDYVPSDINTILISSTNAPIQLTVAIDDTNKIDFSNPTEIGKAFIDGVYYPIIVEINNHLLSLVCEKTIMLEIFYGKDNFI